MYNKRRRITRSIEGCRSPVGPYPPGELEERRRWGRFLTVLPKMAMLLFMILAWSALDANAYSPTQSSVQPKGVTSSLNRRSLHRRRKRRKFARRASSPSPCGEPGRRPGPVLKTDNSTVVEVEVKINEQGNVISAAALNGRMDLRERAVKAALEMRFEPITLKGSPVGQFKRVRLDYTGKE